MRQSERLIEREGLEFRSREGGGGREPAGRGGAEGEGGGQGAPKSRPGARARPGTRTRSHCTEILRAASLSPGHKRSSQRARLHPATAQGRDLAHRAGRSGTEDPRPSGANVRSLLSATEIYIRQGDSLLETPKTSRTTPGSRAPQTMNLDRGQAGKAPRRNPRFQSTENICSSGGGNLAKKIPPNIQNK